MRIRTSAVTLGLILVLASGCASTRTWGLKITEVGDHEIELYLDEPASDSLTLRTMYLHWSGSSATVALSVFSTPPSGSTTPIRLQGGKFLIVWEESGYTGPPVSQPYPSGQTGIVPGIKVAWGEFNQIKTVDGSVSIDGSWTVTYWGGLAGSVTHKIDDSVSFGPSSSLANPTGSGTLQRKWVGVAAPLDTDNDSDWKVGGIFGGVFASNWGVPTP